MAAHSSPNQRQNSRLRKACDFCHQSKVKCTGDRPCARCVELDIPCRYGYVVRLGKPKGSRNRKTLEKAQRLREEAMESYQLCSRTCDPESSNSSGSSTTSERDVTGIERSAENDMMAPWDWNCNWVIFPEGEEPEPEGETRVEGGGVGVLEWGQEEEPIQTPHHSSTDFPIICSSLPLLNAASYDPPMTETIDTNASLPSRRCDCVDYHLHSLAQQCNLTQHPSKKDRFDHGMQVINNVWTTSRALLQCENDHHHPQLFFSMLWSIRLACSWFQSRSSTKQQETPASYEPPNINGIDFRCGEYAIPREQLHVLHDFLVRMAVQDGINLLRRFRSVLETKEATTFHSQANGLSLAPVDINYMLSVLDHCEEGNGADSTCRKRS